MKKYKFLFVSAVLACSSLFSNVQGVPETQSHVVDIRSGELSLVLDGKKILKGSFGATYIMTKVFNDRVQKEGLSDHLIDSYVWCLRHVMDKDGYTHDVIKAIQNGKHFIYFPVNGWLQEQAGHGRQILAMLHLHYLAQEQSPMVEVDGQTIEHLAAIYHHNKGRMHGFAQTVLSELYEIRADLRDHIANQLGAVPEKAPMDANFNPLTSLDLQGNSNYLAVNDHQIFKGSVSILWKAIADYTAGVSQNEKEHAIEEMKKHIPDLVPLCFFDFFNNPEEWKSNTKEGMRVAYDLYLEHIKSL
jgi:hypothetical protein